MKRAALLFVAVTFTGLVHAAEVNPAEAKLREGLKNTMLQLRAVQTEKVALEAAKAKLEQKTEDLTAKVEKMSKEHETSRQDSEKKIAGLTERIVTRGNDVMRIEQELDKSRAAHKEASTLAKKKEADRAKLASEKIALERKVADEQRKNEEMFKVGNEVLTRFEKFSLGTAIVAREPFVGLTRVKLQNLMQEYSDKIADQKIKP